MKANRFDDHSGVKVLFEDNHCLAVDKPAGLLTVGDRSGDTTLFELARGYVKSKYGKPGNVFLGVVHRLDRPVSGVVLFARTSKSAGRLCEQFRSHTVEKVYWACVSGRPPDSSGTFQDFLLKDRTHNTVRCVSEGTAGAQRAELHYRVIRTDGDRSILEVRPRTGRSHQIRVQLASRGLAIAGDGKYGGREAKRGVIALHAMELSFDHPTRPDRITVHADPPGDWSRYVSVGWLAGG